MQKNGSSVRGGIQAGNQISIGVDMGGTLWATSIHDWSTGKDRYHGLRDGESVGKGKESRLFEIVDKYIRDGMKVDVFYEAGRYGYWPARVLESLGASVHILPINKLKVVMCGKVIKTDKLDAKFLGGLHPDDGLPEVYIPTLEEEGRRDAERELARLEECVKRVNACMLALVERTPLPTPKGHRDSEVWKSLLVKWSSTDAWKEVPDLLSLRFKNMVTELELFESELADWKAELERRLEADRKQEDGGQSAKAVDAMIQYKGIGERMARHLSWEIGDFSRFKNGKQFASYFGLTPCPYSSGTMNREQGISKSGRNSLRKMAVEAAWLWYRWQPDSDLVKKWKPRLEQKGRSRRTAIVAMARQLMVALWRNVVLGEPIAGAVVNKPIPA